MSDEVTILLPPPSLRARIDAWRLRRRAARQQRPTRAAQTTLAALSRVPGVKDAGARTAVVLVVTAALVGLVVALVLVGLLTAARAG